MKEISKSAVEPKVEQDFLESEDAISTELTIEDRIQVSKRAAKASATTMPPSNSTIHVDDTDYSIIRYLTKNPRMTFSEVGNRIGRSRPTAKARITRLIENGIIDFNLAVRIDLLGAFQIGVASVKTKKTATSLDLGSCPRVLAAVGPDTNGDYTIMLLGESEESLKNSINRLHQKNAPQITSVTLTSANLQEPYYLSLRTFAKNTSAYTDCAEDCSKCSS
ncbi:MAG: Lrp/AsnC family transcriptional regulator [Candidatus Heimdallarchaeota archaeon]